MDYLQAELSETTRVSVVHIEAQVCGSYDGARRADGRCEGIQWLRDEERGFGGPPWAGKGCMGVGGSAMWSAWGWEVRERRKFERSPADVWFSRAGSAEDRFAQPGCIAGHG